MKSEDIGSAAEKLVQEFRNNSDTSQIILNIKSIDANTDKDAYLSEKQCKACKETLGKNASKKYYCHFCYHASCGNCSMLTSLHPETTRQERICSLCYLKYLNDQVLEISEGFVKTKLKEEISEREKEIMIRKQLVEEIEATKKMMDEKREHHNVEMNCIENEIKIKEDNEKILDEENMRLRKSFEDMVINGKISIEDYRKIDPDFVLPKSKSQEDTQSTCSII